MENKYKISQEIINFLYNGCIAFFPEKFFSEEQKQSPAIFYFGLDKKGFEEKLLAATQSKDLDSAIEKIRFWKIKIDRGEETYSTVPININDLVESYEEKTEKDDLNSKVKLEPNNKKNQETKIEKEQNKEKGEIGIENAKIETSEINLYSPIPQPKIKLKKEQQKIVKLAHQDPQGFCEQLEQKIIESPTVNKDNPLERSSAQIVAKKFTLKLLEIDPKNPEVTIDSSPFETLAFFANPQSEELRKIITDPEAREKISGISREIIEILGKDSTVAANFVNQALEQDWSPLFIPPQIRELKPFPEDKIQKGGVNVNLKIFLEQIANFESIKEQIRNTIISEETYNKLSKTQQSRLDEEIRKAAKRISSASRAFSFVTGKKKPIPTQKKFFQPTSWLNTQLAAIGIQTEPQFSAKTTVNFGNITSPNILSSPLFNFAFDNFIKRIPAVAKLKTVVSGMTTKLATKATAKAATTKLGAILASNVIPVLGQIISAVATIISIKDLVSALKVRLKKNEDKIPFALAGLFVGGFILTGTPIFLVAGAGVIATAKRTSIGYFLGGIFFTLTNFFITSLITPLLIVFIGVPILTAIILFIINSGAYVYPPSTKQAALGPGVIVNEYIEVTKNAYAEKFPEKGKGNSLSFENIQLPLEITYEITIRSKKGSLTNISITETCNVTKENNPPNCPNPSSSIPNGSDIQSIDTTAPYTFKYKRNFASPEFEDTLTIDTISVTASNTKGESVSSAGSASVKIGNPPEECPNNAWPIAGNGGSNLVTQGPLAKACSHENLKQAIDIGVNGATVVATHGGEAVVGFDSCIGKYVKIYSTCNSVEFYSLYAHLGAISVTTGQKVSVGQTIGISDNTGTCTTGPHLHFEFRSNSNIPTVQTPYLTRDIPIGCCSVSTCN